MIDSNSNQTNLMKRTITAESSGNGRSAGRKAYGSANNTSSGSHVNKKSRTNEDDFDNDDEDILMQQKIEVGESITLTNNVDPRWYRPKPSLSLDSKTMPLIIHWLDIDMYSGQPLSKNPAEGEEVPGAQEGPVPIVRLYGVTPDGSSAMVSVHGFTPYFYAHLPHFETNQENLEQLRVAMDTRVRSINNLYKV